MPARRIDAIDTDGHVNSVPQGQNCYFTKLSLLKRIEI